VDRILGFLDIQSDCIFCRMTICQTRANIAAGPAWCSKTKRGPSWDAWGLRLEQALRRQGGYSPGNSDRKLGFLAAQLWLTQIRREFAQANYQSWRV